MTTINININNPGQYFACIGLQYYISRITNQNIKSNFNENDTKFQIHCDQSISEIINKFVQSTIEPGQTIGNQKNPEKETIISLDNHQIIINWYADTTYKSWCNEKSYEILKNLQKQLRDHNNIYNYASEDLFNIPYMQNKPKKEKEKKPFGYDNDYNNYEKSGYNSITTYLATEIFSFIGFQILYFIELNKICNYYTWHTQIPINIIIAAINGQLLPINQQKFKIGTRGDKYKTFRHYMMK